MRLWTAGKPNPASTYLLAYFNASVYNLRSTRKPHYLKISSTFTQKIKLNLHYLHRICVPVGYARLVITSYEV